MNTRLVLSTTALALALGLSACASDKKAEEATAANTTDLLTQRVERAEAAAMEAQRAAAAAQATAEAAKAEAAAANAAAQSDNERLNRAFERSQAK